MMQSVLIVCIGNICRSPIGEALLSFKLQSTHPGILVKSAGLGALVDHPADSMAQTLMQARGIDISNHRSRQASPEIIFASELILTMTSDQQQTIEQQYPSTKGRVHRIGKWGQYDVLDPYKRPQAVFEQALILIDQGVNDWYKKIWS